MIDQSLAHSGHTVPEETRARVARGLKLYRERGDEIEHVWPGVYLVPSAGGNESYAVSLNHERCNCKDRTRQCKHLYAAVIWRAKRSHRRREGE